MQEMKTIIRDMIGSPGSRNFSHRVRKREWMDLKVPVVCILHFPFDYEAANDRIVIRRI